MGQKHVQLQIAPYFKEFIVKTLKKLIFIALVEKTFKAVFLALKYNILKPIVHAFLHLADNN